MGGNDYADPAGCPLCTILKKSLRGYRTEDVDRFLDKVEEQLQQNDAQAEQLRKQIADLTAENQKLKGELQSFEADGDMLKSALINAQAHGRKRDP